jgi:beta-glucanase (GH16 family)
VRTCRQIALLCAVVLLGTMAAPARSAPPAFTDEFAALDPSRWETTGHPLGRSVLDPRNVGVTDGALELGLPAGTTDGAELRTGAAYRGGTFSARIRAARARIAWSRGAVAFSVDGRVLRRWTTGVPAAPMRLYLNAWFPRWLAGIAPPAASRPATASSMTSTRASVRVRASCQSAATDASPPCSGSSANVG